MQFFFVSNCFNSSAALWCKYLFSCILILSVEATDVMLCPETLAVYPNKILLDCEAEVATAALNVPKAVSTVVLEEFTVEELLGKDVISKAGGLQAA